ncbi:hypothetical protein TWF718_007849 [Orbilia javanica]|uniref:Cytochrome P450 n=1 Tax=Orbilia javanica TaxID=47235 RepID=A0AAN8RGT3_9PEZI
MAVLDFIHSAVDIRQVILALVSLATVKILGDAVYQIYFSPLSKVPGPWYMAVSPFYFVYKTVRGNSIFAWKKLHSQYGPCVRVAPNSVILADPESISKVHSPSDIFKKSSWYSNSTNFESLATIRDPEKFKYRRKAFGAAFSNSNLTLLEPPIRKHIEVCFKTIGERMKTQKVVDVKPWIYWVSADIAGEFCFGESFGMVKTEKDNPLIQNTINFVTVMGIQAQVPGFRIISWLLSYIPHPSLEWFCGAEGGLFEYSLMALKNLQKQLQNSKDENLRPTLFSNLLNNINNPEAKYRLPIKDLKDEATVFIVAATDSTSVTAIYVTWSLFRNPDMKQKIITELESVGWTPGDCEDKFTDEMLTELPYLKCFLKEIMRVYAPIQIGIPRLVPDNGRVVGQHFLPGGTECLTQIYTLHRDPELFPDPMAFKPERWINGTKDMDNAIAAFGGTSRICPGRHLAMMELRLMVAMMLKYLHNVELADSATDDSMDFAELFMLHPKANKLELQLRS